MTIINGGIGALLHAFAIWALAVVLLAAPLRAADGPVILAFGDSLTAGYGLEEGDSFPALLQARLAADGVPATVINSGVSGDTTAGGRARLAWSLPEEVDLVILELGANDGLRGVDPAETEANLDAMLAELDKRNIPVLLAGMYAPPNLGREYSEQFNGLFPRLAERYDTAFYPFFLEGVAAEPELNQGDGIHPNAKGVARIVDGIAPYVIEALESGAEDS